MDTPGRGLSDDARFELALGAAAAERRNRPRAMIIVSVAVLVIAAIVALTGLGARASARRLLAKDRQDQAAVEEMTQEWTRLEAQAKEGGEAQGAKMPRLVSTVEELATRAGLKEQPKKPRQTSRSVSGGTMTEYYYSDVKDPSLKSLLDWLRLATSEIPGLEVVGVDLKPETTTWTIQVTFRRWERAG